MTGIDTSINRLTIKKAKSSDFGRYSCVASLGRMGANFKIKNTRTVIVYNDNTGKAGAMVQWLERPHCSR